jgi:predicted secreted Zn-dependent protease
MRFAMIEARPWKQTLTFDAKTDWNVQSNYSFQRDGDQFVLDALRVRAKVVVTLPSWNPGQRVKPDLVARWVQCFRGLSRHEQGHVELARAAAAEVQRRLDSLPACASAEELTAAAERTLNRTLEEFRQKERTYDQVTKHGITQGAVFPMTNLEARE